MPAFIDLTGQVFGRWTVVSYAGKGTSMWNVRCACGTESVVLGPSLKKGGTRSCGCLRVEVSRAKATKHGTLTGGAQTKTYSIWKAMKKRCNNPNNSDYAYYGGRGIKVCERWAASYEAFLEDMGECPGSDMTIDRIEGSRDYEPGNCRWATRLTQAENRCSTKIVEFEGERMSVSAFAKKIGKRQQTVWRNIVKQGMTPEEVARRPKGKTAWRATA